MRQLNAYLISIMIISTLILSGCKSDNLPAPIETLDIKSLNDLIDSWENSPTIVEPVNIADCPPCGDLNWNVSPGAYVGGVPLPAQLYGSFGSCDLYKWENGQQTSKVGSLNEIIGTPNGTTMINWNENEAPNINSGMITVECCIGWGVYETSTDYSKGWEVGAIWDMTLGSNALFIHVWERKLNEAGEPVLNLWEALIGNDDPIDEKVALLNMATTSTSNTLDGYDIYYFQTKPIGVGDEPQGIKNITDQSYWATP